MRDQPTQHVHVETPQGPSGSLAREQDQYVFTYVSGPGRSRTCLRNNCGWFEAQRFIA